MAKENKVISADDFASDIPVESMETNESESKPTVEVDTTSSEIETISEEPKDEIKVEEVKKVKRTGSETEIREVDPTQNKKLQKRMKQKPTTVGVGGIKIPKKVLYIAAPVLIVLIMLLVKLISSGVGGSKETNYFSILDSILQTEQGQFTYTIDVRTKAVEQVAKTETSNADYNEVANTEGGDIPEELQQQPVMKNQFTDSWGTADDVKVFSWQYPQYKIIIDGVCLNADPNAYEADIKISLATVGHNDMITEILVKDGKYYVDFNSLGVWLRSSKDAYLMSLGADIPEGAKFVVISAEDFKIPSRYAEDYELDNSSVVGIHDNIRTLNALLAYLESNLKDCIGKECYSTSVSEGGGNTEHLTIGVNTGNKITERVKALALNSSSTYDGYVTVLKNNGLLTDAQYQQKINEKDNFLYAINPLQVYFNTKSIEMTNLQAIGSARQYKSGTNQDIAEADLHLQFQSDSKSYDVQISLSRKLGTLPTIETDTTNVVDIHQLVADESIDGRTYLLGKFNRLIDYLNPTCIQLSKQMEMNPDRISESIKQSLVDIVNSMPEQTGVYLTTLTVDKYIEIYKELIDKKDELTGTDKVNALIVEDFLKTVNDITGGVIIEVPVEAEVEQIVYPELVYEDSDMKIIANFNQDLSNKNVYVVSTTIMNKNDYPITLNLTNFSLRTLLSSTYSSNNLTTLRDNDNTWDETLTPQSIELEASSYADIDLYFVVAGDSGYMDMWYQPIDKEPIKLGVIIQE